MRSEIEFQVAESFASNPHCFQSLDSSKRAFDAFAAGLGIFLLSPLLLLFGLALLMLQGRPLIYRHQRVGLNGRLFNCYKIRTMVRDSDAVLQKHLKSDGRAAEEWSASQKLLQDPRVTRFGHFLRVSSLDELPQLFNVLRGDMSLVGPRPVVPEELRRYGDLAHLYLSVRPGLTGPWQIGARNDCSYEDRVKLDATYVKSRTFVGDLLIIIKTAAAVVGQTGR